MSPFKSIAGRALGKLLEGYRSSDIGKGFGAGSSTATITMSGGLAVVGDEGIIYHVFTSPGTLDLIAGSGDIYYTLVAGGGGGAGYGPAYFGGANGQPTTAFGFTAIGGGGGGSYPGGAGQAGGSGGGGGTAAAGGAATNYPGPTQQGYPGGSGASTYEGGGGGGAGAVGENGTPGSKCGDGGDGKILLNDAPSSYRNSIPTAVGTPGPTPGRWVAGGGGSGSGSSPARGAGGAGGGAAGGKTTSDPVAGVINTGGGGGGFENDGGGGGAGGGGAGGYIDGILEGQNIGNGPYAIVIGAGGSPAPAAANNPGGSGMVIVASSGQ